MMSARGMENGFQSNQRAKSRRDLLSIGTAAGMAALWAPQAQAHGNAHGREITGPLHVQGFGAAGDGKTDDTSAFQKALDAAGQRGGGTVYVPPGRYLLKGTLNLRGGVTLRGSYGCVPSHTGLRNAGQAKPGDDGTALLVTAGRGAENGEPFLTLNTNSTVAGLTVYYPEQIEDAEPLPYPWTIAMRGKNPAVLDVELLNAYQGIDASRNERHNIRNVTGQPLRRGIWVDAIYDIGRIENVHFNPWWSSNKKLQVWQLQNGEAFLFGRADWEYVLNTFCFGYRVGYKFVETDTGSCNGNFLGIGADDCNRAILVEQAAAYGLLITNGEFTSFQGDDPTIVEVLGSNKGVVRVGNSAFWGPCNQIAKIAGSGTVGFSECTFVQWGKQPGRAAIQATGGNLLVQGCEFRQDKPHIALSEAIGSGVIVGNLFAGAAQIEHPSRPTVQIGLNAELTTGRV
jgi:Pectate lyase superfamily protein